ERKGPPRFEMGKVLPPFVRESLDLTPAQQDQIAELEKEVRERLRKILTAEQQKRAESIQPKEPRDGKNDAPERKKDRSQGKESKDAPSSGQEKSSRPERPDRPPFESEKKDKSESRGGPRLTLPRGIIVVPGVDDASFTLS